MQKKKKKAKMQANREVEPTVTFDPALPEVVAFVCKTKITEFDPAVVLDWDIPALIRFTERANLLAPGVGGVPLVPVWIRTAPPQMTPHSLVNDIVNKLVTVAGGRFHHIILAPNTTGQYGNVREVLTGIELDPFIQACMAGAPAGDRLCNVGILLGKKDLVPQPANRLAPRDRRQVFA